MLPRPRLVCPVFCTDLICFIAYILNFFIPLWIWLGTLQDCHHAQCPLPLSIVIRMRLVIRQSKLPACLADVQLAHENTLAFMPQNWWNWFIKWVKLYQWEVFSTRTEWMEILCIPVSNFTYFSLESRLIPAVLELGLVRLFWKLIRSRIWQLSHSCQSGVWEYFPVSLALK